MKYTLIFLLVSSCLLSCKVTNGIVDTAPSYFTWDAAKIYFLLTDRFYNGNPENDHQPAEPAARLRGYMGGDFAGITQKIEEGYFEKLGVDAIWISPVAEQISSGTNEGTGISYAFHGYWAKDWTTINPIFGTDAELRQMVKTAHQNGLRVLVDVVLNHTGPVTAVDPVWPSSWVKTKPACVYKDAATTINCTLVENLPDIKTENRTEDVELPAALVDKWKAEGRYEQEVAELDAFFRETGYPRTPYHYLIKWTIDLVRDFGFDGFRVDTVKHTEDYVWADLYREAVKAWEGWKARNPEEAIDDAPFYMMGEVYGYYLNGGRWYDYGDRKVDFFKDGFHSMINFDFKYDAKKDLTQVYARYDSILHNQLEGKSTVHYISSHDDGGPLDMMRVMPEDAGSYLLLAPGAVQVYYGDETARVLDDSLAQGDAKLRSFMNWKDLEPGTKEAMTLDHWQKVGQFRNDHPAVGAGRHLMIQQAPFVFSRTYLDDSFADRVVVGLDQSVGRKSIPTGAIFENGQSVRCYYSGAIAIVQDGIVKLDTPYDIVLLELVDEQ